MGVPISPLCDREKDQNIAKSQIGFFKFVCIPFYEARHPPPALGAWNVRHLLFT